MTASTWSPSRGLSRAVAGIRNFYAGTRAMTPAIALVQDTQSPVFTLEDPLPRYSMVCTCRCSYGECLIGLDVGAISHAYAGDTVSQVAQEPTAIREWLDWLVTPWMGPIERHLGVPFSLVKGELNAVFPWDSVAFCIDVNGKRGHVAIAGEGLDRLPWQALLVSEKTERPPMHLLVEVYALISAGSFPLRNVRKLARGGMLRLAEWNYQLHLGALKHGIRLGMSYKDEGMGMGALTCDNADQWNVISPERRQPDGSSALEDIGLTVEVVLDQRLISLAEVERLRKGSVYAIPSGQAGKAVAICCNGRIFARGELVSVEGQLGVLVSEGVGDVL